MRVTWETNMSQDEVGTSFGNIRDRDDESIMHVICLEILQRQIDSLRMLRKNQMHI